MLFACVLRKTYLPTRIVHTFSVSIKTRSYLISPADIQPEISIEQNRFTQRKFDSFTNQSARFFYQLAVAPRISLTHINSTGRDYGLIARLYHPFGGIKFVFGITRCAAERTILNGHCESDDKRKVMEVRRVSGYMLYAHAFSSMSLISSRSRNQNNSGDADGKSAIVRYSI